MVGASHSKAGATLTHTHARVIPEHKRAEKLREALEVQAIAHLGGFRFETERAWWRLNLSRARESANLEGLSTDSLCTRCGAPLELPADFAVWLVRCQYCGFEHELPDSAQRQAYAERRRQEWEYAAQTQAAASAQQSAAKVAARRNRALVIALCVLPILLVLGAVQLIEHAVSGSSVGFTDTSTPPPELVAAANKAQTGGCPVVADAVNASSEAYSGTFHTPKSECIRYLALGVPQAALKLAITDPAGVVTTRQGALGLFDTTFCPTSGAEHHVKLSGAAEVWVVALGCPRTFASDPETTGKAKVGSKLKQLMAHGCYEMSLANSTFVDDRKLTTDLAAGTCFELVAATGVAGNALKLTMSTPFGEAITPMPAPATELETEYCAASAGPHIAEIEGALNGPYSLAIAICNRNAFPKVLPKAAK